MGIVNRRGSGTNTLLVAISAGVLLCAALLWFGLQRSSGAAPEMPFNDQPDKAAELNFMQTMDPALRRVPSERLRTAARYMDELLGQRAPISGVAWQERGPSNVGGRTRALMFDPNDTNHKKVWAGGVGGGLWFTDDITVASPVWQKVNDFWANIAVTAIAYNPGNTMVFYAGTGEGWYNEGPQNGAGIWKSANGGVTWTQLASTIPSPNSGNFLCVQKIVVKSDGTVFGATRGNNSGEGGIMRSTDGGISWTRVITTQSRGADVEVAANGDIYASAGFGPSGAGSTGALFKSLNADNGALGTWTDLSGVIGVTGVQRIELACAPSNANVIYAVAKKASFSNNNDVSWLKKSIDGGASWTTKTIPLLVDDGVTHFTRSQAFYDLILAVHPTDTGFVIAGGIDLHRSLNGGTTWFGISHSGPDTLAQVHVDQHAIVFRPGASNEVLFGNDGGVYLSTNAGNSGVAYNAIEIAGKNNGYNVTQFYACAAKNTVNSQYFLAGAQDNGTQIFTQPQLGMTMEATPGDGGFCHIDQLDPNIQLAAASWNRIYRSLDGGSSFSLIVDEFGVGFFINPSEYDSDRKILYSSGLANKLKRVKGIDGVITDTTFSLTLGGGQITAIKLSPYNDVLFLGVYKISSFFAGVYKLENASTPSPTLTRIDLATNPFGAMFLAYVSSIDVGEDDNHIMVTFSNYGVTSVWQTTDGGANWYSKEGNLPDMPIRWAMYNPDNRNQVLAATELGIWSTNNFGYNNSASPTWGASNTGLAHTRCAMLTYRPADKMVVIATHGRGLYTSDIFVTTSVADFVVDPNTSCTGSLVAKFKDASLKPVGSWEWDVDNNGTVDYTTQNPTHTYSSDGVYSVRLTVNSGDTSITKDDAILVMSSEPTLNTGCTLTANSNEDNAMQSGLYRFALGSINNPTLYNDGYYQNYVCSKSTSLRLNTAYDITIRTGTVNSEGARVYIDYNNDGTFQAAEAVVSFPANTDGTRTLSFTTPASGVTLNTGLRLRVLSKEGGIPSTGCDIGTYGQAEDYTVFFGCSINVNQVSGTGTGSLPAAVNCASPGDTIRISTALTGQTIQVGPELLLLNKNLVILAQGSNIRVTGSGASVSPGVNLQIIE